MPDQQEYERLLLAKAEIMMRGGAYAESTRQFYAQNWGAFAAWCHNAGREALPAAAQTILLYLTELLLVPKKMPTVRRYLTAIRHRHLQNGFPSPVNWEIKALIKGAQRMRSERTTQKRPVTVDLLRSMLGSLKGKAVMVARNRALLTLGFSSALRRASLCHLDLRDVTFNERGVLLEIRNEKQDKQGRGRQQAVARGKNPETCPARALEEWVRLRGSQPGALFTPVYGRRAMTCRLHPSTIAYVVKVGAASLGLKRLEFGAHSLRAGLVTTSFGLGHNEISIMQQTGHRSLSSLRRYLRESDPFRGNISGSVGL